METVSMGEFCDEKLVETEGLVFVLSFVGFPQADKRRGKRTETLGETTHTNRERHRQAKTDTDREKIFVFASQMSRDQK